MAYFPPPIPDDFPNPEILKNMTPEDLKEFRNSKTYEKYVVPAIERDNQLKKEQRIDWFWVKGLLIINTIFAGISTICAIISLLK